MSKETTLIAIAEQITAAVAANSITPIVLGAILTEIVNLEERPYKVCSGLISQTATNAPTVIVLENTIGNIIWTRAVSGDYFGTLAGAFPSEKTFTQIAVGSINSSGRAEIFQNNVDKIEIGTYTTFEGQTRCDDWLYFTPFEIRVYN